MLDMVVHEATAAGFQIIYSRHTATNNPVILAKLRRGFVITGMELSDVFGLLVRVSLYTNPLRREALGVRSGEIIPGDQLRALLGL